VKTAVRTSKATTCLLAIYVIGINVWLFLAHAGDSLSDKGGGTVLGKFVYDTFSNPINAYTFVLAVFTILLAGAAFFQLLEMRKSSAVAILNAKTAYETLVVTNRPWISVDIGVVGDFVFTQQNEVRVAFEFTLKNVGSSPAANVEVDAKLISFLGDVRPIQKEIADKNRSRPGQLGHSGITIFPGEVVVQRYSLPISWEEIEAFNQKFAEDTDGILKPFWLRPILVGCVDYKFTFAEGHRQTGFILNLYHVAQTNPHGTFVFELAQGTFPANTLQLRRDFMAVPPD